MLLCLVWAEWYHQSQGLSTWPLGTSAYVQTASCQSDLKSMKIKENCFLDHSSPTAEELLAMIVADMKIKATY